MKVLIDQGRLEVEDNWTGSSDLEEVSLEPVQSTRWTSIYLIIQTALINNNIIKWFSVSIKFQ